MTMTNHRFSRLKQDLGGNFDRFFSNVAPLFLQDAQEKISSLGKAIQDQDDENIRFISHTLKGGAYTLTLDTLANCLRTLETEREELAMRQLFHDIQKELVLQNEKIEQELARIANS